MFPSYHPMERDEVFETSAKFLIRVVNGSNQEMCTSRTECSWEVVQPNGLITISMISVGDESTGTPSYRTEVVDADLRLDPKTRINNGSGPSVVRPDSKKCRRHSQKEKRRQKNSSLCRFGLARFTVRCHLRIADRSLPAINDRWGRTFTSRSVWRCPSFVRFVRSSTTSPFSPLGPTC